LPLPDLPDCFATDVLAALPRFLVSAACAIAVSLEAPCRSFYPRH
jgi:hypothetical protein